VGSRKFESRPIGEKTTGEYYGLVNILIAHNPDEQKIITLDEKAYGFLKGFAEKIEPMLIDELSEIVDYAGKLVGTVLRIAGLLYIAGHMPLGQDELILPEDCMRSAIAIGEYFLEHAKAAYQLMGADEAAEQCKYILRQLKKSQPSAVTVRDIMRVCQKFKTAESISAPLARLCEYGYLKEIQAEQSENGKGRPPARQWEVNLAAYSTEIQNKEAPDKNDTNDKYKPKF
jgi:hypothetical protein